MRPTCDLRFVERGVAYTYKRILQQRWEEDVPQYTEIDGKMELTHYAKKGEWRDVPVDKEINNG